MKLGIETQLRDGWDASENHSKFGKHMGAESDPCGIDSLATWIARMRVGVDMLHDTRTEGITHRQHPFRTINCQQRVLPANREKLGRRKVWLRLCAAASGRRQGRCHQSRCSCFIGRYRKGSGIWSIKAEHFFTAGDKIQLLFTGTFRRTFFSGILAFCNGKAHRAGVFAIKGLSQAFLHRGGLDRVADSHANPGG